MFVIWSVGRARDQKKLFKANPKINILGIKKNIPLESLVFYGFCHSLETKLLEVEPLARKVFAGHWT